MNIKLNFYKLLHFLKLIIKNFIGGAIPHAISQHLSNVPSSSSSSTNTSTTATATTTTPYFSSSSSSSSNRLVSINSNTNPPAKRYYIKYKI